MVKRIVWSKFALENKLEILKYWNHRNKSNVYSKKLNKLFISYTRLIRDYESLGRKTSDPKVRFIIISNYLMFFEVHKEEIHILHIWDTRRNPEDLIYELNK
ncbi:MAG: type II toxin-antitoxin system RelE/ParE family toxin [Chitinophagales bacterium]|jgi:plasmid stabilization system protein ParE|nr:type II toxin-antitoxin system RelE/ParE family toxin [Sphingobacteriales bacterium]